MWRRRLLLLGGLLAVLPTLGPRLVDGLVRESEVQDFVETLNEVAPDEDANEEDDERDAESEALVVSVASTLRRALNDGHFDTVPKVFKALRASPGALLRVLTWSDEDGSTALHWAAHGGGGGPEEEAYSAAVLRVLVSMRALDLTAVDQDGRTACHVACEQGNAAGLAQLLNASSTCDPLKADRGGHTCLHLAAAGGHETVLAQLGGQTLLPLDARLQDGSTALSLAVRAAHQEAALWLVKGGANTTLGPDSMGPQGPRGYARQRLEDFTEIVRLLQRSGSGPGTR